MENLQFYPTPENLARTAWSLFQDRDFLLVLEPSAGNGDLLDAKPYDVRNDRIHAAEIDLRRHAALREKGTVVGVDFFEMSGLSMYSHVIMNPPFRNGAEHVLYAWDGLLSGEIVAILNAETIRNPFSEKRERLVKLIEKNGSVRYEKSAFLDPDTQRKTDVEVALVWLKKTPEAGCFSTDFLDGLKKDAGPEAVDFEIGGEIALRGETIKNLVIAFQEAWQAELATVGPRMRADHFRGMLGLKLADLVSNAEKKERPNIRVQTGLSGKTSMRKYLAETYDGLKERAWTAVLMATETEKYLTRKAVDRIRAEFSYISKLEFSLPNIYGFLQGLAESQGDIHLDICLDLFDRITRQGTENVAFYRPWKSNAKHRVGMRIRNKRFILGGFSLEGWRRGLGWSEMQSLKDLDRAFAILDGKTEPEISLESVFEEGTSSFQNLRDGERVSCSYMDVRFYPGIGTIHFFPTRPDLIDRLNLLVGRARSWIPGGENEGFWAQYADAEKISDKAMKRVSLARWEGKESKEEKISEALESTQKELGYHMDWNASIDHAEGAQSSLLLEHVA